MQNLITISSAVGTLRMREKTGFRVFFLFMYPSIDRSIDLSIYPYLTTPTGHIFSAILTLNGSYNVFLQPLVPFGDRDKMPSHLGGKIPQKPPFWARE